jgi:hypothetical protein
MTMHIGLTGWQREAAEGSHEALPTVGIDIAGAIGNNALGRSASRSFPRRCPADVSWPD